MGHKQAKSNFSLQKVSSRSIKWKPACLHVHVIDEVSHHILKVYTKPFSTFSHYGKEVP